jgi:hypothetical protein
MGPLRTLRHTIVVWNLREWYTGTISVMNAFKSEFEVEADPRSTKTLHTRSVNLKSQYSRTLASHNVSFQSVEPSGPVTLMFQFRTRQDMDALKLTPHFMVPIRLADGGELCTRSFQSQTATAANEQWRCRPVQFAMADVMTTQLSESLLHFRHARQFQQQLAKYLTCIVDGGRECLYRNRMCFITGTIYFMYCLPLQYILSAILLQAPIFNIQAETVQRQSCSVEATDT